MEDGRYCEILPRLACSSKHTQTQTHSIAEDRDIGYIGPREDVYCAGFVCNLIRPTLIGSGWLYVQYRENVRWGGAGIELCLDPAWFCPVTSLWLRLQGQGLSISNSPVAALRFASPRLHTWMVDIRTECPMPTLRCRSTA